MQINKFKKVGSNKYKVIFDSTELLLYEDIILKYDLLIKKNIDEFLLDEIISENSYYDAYDKALGYIEAKLRTKKEIIDYLDKKGFDEKYIDYAIEKINKLGLLDDKLYVQSYVNDKINLTLDGPYKIRSYLLNLDIDESIINSYLNKIDKKIWYEKLDKIINKKQSLMNKKSYYMFINKLKNDLYNLGYDKEIIDEKLSNIKYSSNAIEKDFEKANKKYKDDKNKIVSSLLRKGYSYEEILNQFD